MNFVCFITIHSKQQHFNLTNAKLVYCLHGESIFLDKISLKTVSESFIFCGTQAISVRREISWTYTLYILHIYKQLTEYIS